MKKQFIKQTKKALSVPRQTKKEIARDLEEIFASALEHGENEAQVIERLGSPEDFAENMEEQLEFHHPGNRNRKKRRQIIGCFAAALLFFLFTLVVSALQTPNHIIGQAESMTGIRVEETAAFYPLFWAAVLGAAALCAAAVLTVQYIQAKRREDKRC